MQTGHGAGRDTRGLGHRAWCETASGWARRTAGADRPRPVLSAHALVRQYAFAFIVPLVLFGMTLYSFMPTRKRNRPHLAAVQLQGDTLACISCS